MNFVLAAQDPITGGLGKYPEVHPDALHAYLGISGLALMNEAKLNNLGIRPVDPSLNISQRAMEQLHTIHRKWS